jgi:hypothetical protein
MNLKKLLNLDAILEFTDQSVAKGGGAADYEYA